MRAAVVFVVVLLGVVFATTPIDQAKITSLPGLDFTPSFDQYSGYITLEGTTKNIFYWFITAQTNPSTAPVLLWLQGGPGCSGLGDGLLLEHGPFSPYSPDGSKVNLESRYFSWNKEANIIYVESPCGVGFSYGDSSSDYHTNDNQTALDNYLFLQGFFDVYTDWADNEFWITGESYGGVYITTLAYQVLNNNSDPQLQSNLKRGGLMLGNPVTNCDTAAYTGTNNVLSLDTQVGMFYWHGMVSRDNYDDWTSNQCNTANPPSSAKCETLYATIIAGVGNLDQPLALEMRDSLFAERIEKRVEEARAAAPVPNAAVNPDMLYYSYCTGNGTLDFNVAQVPNCFGLDDQVDAYLNTAAVQQAIHAQPTKWEECGGVIYDKTVGSVIPYLENFFQVAPNMRILYYSGDIDIATVPFAQTQRCLETMSRKITAPWRPYVINSEVAGYVEVYDTYTYATVKAAGHEAPQYQAEANYVLFSSFLNNQNLPQ